VPVERVIVMMVLVLLLRPLSVMVLVHGRRCATPASGRRRPLILAAHDVRAATTAATAQRRSGRRLMSDAADDGRGRRTGSDAHLMVARLHVVLVTARAAALHRHGPRPAPTAPQLIPVAGPGDGVQPHAVRVSLSEHVISKHNIVTKLHILYIIL